MKILARMTATAPPGQRALGAFSDELVRFATTMMSAAPTPHSSLLLDELVQQQMPWWTPGKLVVAISEDWKMNIMQGMKGIGQESMRASDLRAGLTACQYRTHPTFHL